MSSWSFHSVIPSLRGILFSGVRRFFGVPQNDNRKSFTLIELLIVLAIVAILSVVVVATLNPVELLRQARDSNRLSDLSTINSALGVFNTDVIGSFMGTSSIVYISVPDTSKTCANLGLPTLPTGWLYNCVTATSTRNNNGTGWIPVNFRLISFGSVLSSLPIDPINTTSTNYYTYATGGSWQVSSRLESQKYQPKAALTNNYDPGLYVLGTNTNLAPFVGGLIGWWKFDEGNNSTTTDSSGYGFTGTWNGTSTTHFVAGRVGPYAGYFNGSSDYVAISNPPQTRQMSFSFWDLPNGAGNRTVMSLLRMIPRSSTADIILQNLGVSNVTYTRANSGSWEHVVITNNVLSANQVKFYVNGVLVQTSNSSYGNATNGSQIGGYAGANLFSGNIDDLRVYNRVLTDAEVLAIYNNTQ